jgi:hypothetical protein
MEHGVPVLRIRVSVSVGVGVDVVVLAICMTMFHITYNIDANLPGMIDYFSELCISNSTIQMFGIGIPQ